MNPVHIPSIPADLSFRQTPISNLDPLPCLGIGYELVGTNIYTINIGLGIFNLLKGLVNLITGLVAPPVNAIGYHTVQNYIYGVTYTTTPQAIVRIGAGGSFEVVGPNAVIPASVTTEQLLIGDVDANQQYWLGHSGGQGWVQVDLTQGSTFGAVVDSGAASAYRYPVGDWAYVPAFPNKLWALSQEIVSNITGLVSQYNTHLVYFDLSTKAWNEVYTFVNTPGGLLGQAQWGAVYTANDGNIYATESNTGQTFRFPLNATVGSFATPITLLGTLPLFGNQIDGARCALNDNLSQ